MNVPYWVVIAAGIFFLVNILFYVVLIIAVIKIIPMIQQMSNKVGELTAKVEEVAKRVEEVAKSAQETIGNVGQKATGILGSVELIAQAASRQFERFAPYLVGATTAMRLIKSLNEIKHGRSPAEATKKKTLEKRPATPPRKKFLGLF